jgi:hypothetical protein
MRRLLSLSILALLASAAATGCSSDPKDSPNTSPLTTEECRQQAYDACIAAGGDAERCTESAALECEDPADPPPPDCLERVYDACVTNGGSAEDCRAAAAEECNPTDPPTDPPPPPPEDCIAQAFERCAADGGTTEECRAYAVEACAPAPSPDPGHP